MTKHKTAKAFTLVLLLCLLSYPAQFSFATDGNEWNTWPKEVQDTYVIGVIDAFSVAHQICLHGQAVGDIKDCVFTKALVQPVTCF